MTSLFLDESKENNYIIVVAAVAAPKISMSAHRQPHQ